MGTGPGVDHTHHLVEITENLELLMLAKVMVTIARDKEEWKRYSRTMWDTK